MGVGPVKPSRKYRRRNTLRLWDSAAGTMVLLFVAFMMVVVGVPVAVALVVYWLSFAR